MYATLVEYVAFGQINLLPTLIFFLGALVLAAPFMLVEALVETLERVYWQNRFQQVEVPVFVLPPEIAALPLEVDESKILHLKAEPFVLPIWIAMLPETENVKLDTSMKQEVDDMFARINEMLDRAFDDSRYENSLMVWS